MNHVLKEFERRVDEIDIYFNYLALLKGETQLYFPSTNEVLDLDEELVKILKANAFIILYNLMESSIKKGMQEIYNLITSANLPYKKVRDEIKKIWIKEGLNNFHGQSESEIFRILKSISKDIININFNPKKVISGNVNQIQI